jgi:hypothetical protein
MLKYPRAVVISVNTSGMSRIRDELVSLRVRCSARVKPSVWDISWIASRLNAKSMSSSTSFSGGGEKEEEDLSSIRRMAVRI